MHFLLRLFLIVLSVIIVNSGLAYTTDVHQYIVRQSWELLKYQVAGLDETTLNDKIGTSQTGRWDGFLVGGAIAEDDETDIVYGYDTFIPTPWMAHFWRANGTSPDNNTWTFGVTTYNNAYQKAQVYMYGSDPGICIPEEGYIGPNRYISMIISYNSLMDFVKTGRAQWPAVINSAGIKEYFSEPVDMIFGETKRALYGYELLGSACHLLADMSVPAHVKNDDHATGDTYESYAQTNYEDADYLTAFNDGGIFYDVITMDNPLRYLMYMSNQIADYFPSDGGQGGLSPGHPDYEPYSGTDYYSYLDEKMPLLAIYDNSSVESDEILEVCLNQAIRSTASLLYWFLSETEGVPLAVNTVNELTQVDLEGQILVNSDRGSWTLDSEDGFPIAIEESFSAKTLNDEFDQLAHHNWKNFSEYKLCISDVVVDAELLIDGVHANYAPRYSLGFSSFLIENGSVRDPWAIDNPNEPPESWTQSGSYMRLESAVDGDGKYRVFLDENPLFQSNKPVYEISAPRYMATENGIYEFSEWGSVVDVGQLDADFNTPNSRNTQVVIRSATTQIIANYSSSAVNNITNYTIEIDEDDFLNLPAGATYSFQQGVTIIAEGQLNILGTAEEPVTIVGSGYLPGQEWITDFEESIIQIGYLNDSPCSYNIQHLNIQNAPAAIVIDDADESRAGIQVSLSDLSIEDCNIGIVFRGFRDADPYLSNVKIIDCEKAFLFDGEVEAPGNVDFVFQNCEVSGDVESIVALSPNFDEFEFGVTLAFINCNLMNTNTSPKAKFDVSSDSGFGMYLYNNIIQNVEFEFGTPTFVWDVTNLLINSEIDYQSSIGGGSVSFLDSDQDFRSMFKDYDSNDFSLNYNDFLDHYILDKGTIPGNIELYSDLDETSLDIGANYIHQTNISSATTLQSNTTWEGIYNVAQNVTVNVGVTLTIAPATGVRFHKAPAGRFGLTVNGNLEAEGTADAPIYFTSFEDYKTISDWNGIVINYYSNPNITIIDHCVVEYSYNGVYLNSTSPVVSNNLIKHNYFGIHARNGCTSDISSNHLWQNTYGAYNYLASPTYTDNLISQSNSRGMNFYGTSTPKLFNNSVNNSGQFGMYLSSNADVQLGTTTGGVNGTKGYNEVVGNTLYGIYAYSSDPFLGTTGPYNLRIGGSNSVHGSGSYNVYANGPSTGTSTVLADWNHWNEESKFGNGTGSSISHANEIGNPFDPPQLGSSLAKGGTIDATTDCPDYDFFEPDTSSECALWHWAHDLRITDQLPIALWAWELYVERFPGSENAPRALVKLANFTPEEDRAELISYLNTVLETSAYSDELRVKALELLVALNIKTIEYTDALVCATALLEQSLCDDQEKFALLSLIDLSQTEGIGKAISGRSYYDQLVEKYPGDEITLMAAELMGEEVDWSKMTFEMEGEEEEELLLPENFALYAAYPNPFNPVTTIRYDLPKEAQVQLTVFDLTGRLVSTLVSKSQDGGKYEVQWGGIDANGNTLPSGLYLYRLQAGEFVANEKMLLLK